MEVTHYKVWDTWYRQMVDGSHAALTELRQMYAKDGLRTWVNLHTMGIKPKWVLTVEECRR